ncbi:MAG: NAD(P)H-hydrate dehydratase [Candidatus Pacebacteria bacterium]|nr:NAD(P)H-hydrate dehydratase [Candidatus Paceibacterota bacterium]
MQKITKDILKKVYYTRKPESHKYDYGLLLVVGGGNFYTGSPALSAMAAFRAGVDMTHILAPRRAADIIAGFSPNLAAYPFKGDWFDNEDLPTILSFTESAKEVAGGRTAVVLGGGMGRSEETKEAILSYLGQTYIRAVIDADGIHAVAKNLAVVKDRHFVFTPHAYEFFVLTGRDIREAGFEEKIRVVQEEAARLGCVIVLKGNRDIISDGQEAAIDEGGSPFMTVGGTGDTLAGIAGSLLAQGIEPFLAAQAASYINGKAGEAAAKKYGPGMTAVDLIEEIANVIK